MTPGLSSMTRKWRRAAFGVFGGESLIGVKWRSRAGPVVSVVVMRQRGAGVERTLNDYWVTNSVHDSSWNPDSPRSSSSSMICLDIPAVG